jgi:hypothetical protein
MKRTLRKTWNGLRKSAAMSAEYREMQLRLSEQLSFSMKSLEQKDYGFGASSCARIKVFKPDQELTQASNSEVPFHYLSTSYARAVLERFSQPPWPSNTTPTSALIPILSTTTFDHNPAAYRHNTLSTPSKSFTSSALTVNVDQAQDNPQQSCHGGSRHQARSNDGYTPSPIYVY